MDARQLYRSLEYVVGGSCEVYVVARDYVRNIFYMGRNLMVAVNSSVTGEAGSHWVVFYIYRSGDGIVCEFYDSYGRLPEYRRIDYPYPLVNYNAIVHQRDDSPSCALFVIFFAYHRIYRPPFRRAVSYFSKNTSKNEQQVIRFYNYIKDEVSKMPQTNIECKEFGCYPKTNDSLKRRLGE